MTKNKDEKYHWTSVGTVAIGNKLFGQNVAEQVNRKHTNCVYTEGEWDCVSVFPSHDKIALKGLNMKDINLLL